MMLPRWHNAVRGHVGIRSERDTKPLASDAVIIGSVGIVTSGVLGPAVAARWARARQDREFENDRKVRRNEDLRHVLDDAAVLLGAGITNLRRAFEATSAGRESPPDVQEWASRVHLARERILLRVSERDQVVSRYTEARDALTGSLGKAIENASPVGSREHLATTDLNAAIEDFEAKRSAFLAAARALLDDRTTSQT
jgi:hypothetical protein